MKQHVAKATVIPAMGPPIHTIRLALIIEDAGTKGARAVCVCVHQYSEVFIVAMVTAGKELS